MPTVPDGLYVDELTLDPSGLSLLARTTAAQAACPTCGHASSRVHSRHLRTLQDLPWQDRAVTWRVQVRRFRCSHCPGRIFVERIPGLMGSKARRTARLSEAQTEIGMVLGGEAGARLSRRLCMPVSGDTVLRLIRRHPPRAYPAPRVVGIDDWAWRRGRRYGTIVCDLERHRVLALLPGRSSAPVRDWLAAHPGIAVVSRDRAGPYAEAARSGAPGAIQVADRWHLLVNASETLRSVVARYQTQIQRAEGLRSPSGSMPAVPVPAPSLSQPSENRRRRFDDVLHLHAEGLPILQITHRTGLARNTVRSYLRVGTFVPYRRAPGPSLLDQHRSFAEARWQEGVRSGAALHRELRARGFGGGVDIVRRWIVQRRETAPDRSRLRHTPSTRRTTRLLASDPTMLGHAERAFLDALCEAAPEVGITATHVRAFADLLRQDDPAGLEPWLDAAAATGLCGFAAGLRQDLDAVRAAITQPWSNGPVEGQVNRLKLIKRQMYGRTGFDLLQQRVLHPA
ncbi:ISL3 family transposase [Methylobacterium sp. BTF04]|uniref:ISL3 family transposase n=1 Tax=Methylobacterium sp. BTF04 TaxID=2708300 RepID=UPI0013CFD7DA|nr:ISL3 family transposase [Methylobacterium sp. BTF04]NEU14724.1 ISL3 family transposase [Methylobacterium sp. BTF04]